MQSVGSLVGKSDSKEQSWALLPSWALIHCLTLSYTLLHFLHTVGKSLLPSWALTHCLTHCEEGIQLQKRSFFNIAQKSFDPPSFWTRMLQNFWSTLEKVRKRLSQQDIRQNNA